LMAVDRGRHVLVEGADPNDFSPGKKQCRWCRAPATGCAARLKFVENEIRSDFETIHAAPPVAPRDSVKLAAAYVAVPLIEQWCAAVIAEMQRRVTEGEQILGPDGKPYKYTAGKEGARAWTDAKMAEEALLGQLGPKAYSEPKLITAPVAAKLLNKKATATLWTDLFEPLISRPRGRPILVLGSDPRPVFTDVATADDFDDVAAE
jgi:hypothetical protein